MNAPSANLSVWVGENLACIKISGRANFSASLDFKALVKNLCRQGPHHFVLDLTECLLMDSTFLGVLAGMGQRFESSLNGDGQNSIEIFNPSLRITDMLDNLGIAHLFRVSRGDSLITKNMEHIDPDQAERTSDRKEISRTCLEAHKTLMEINPANVPKFKDVTRFLAEDLKRMEAEEHSD